MHCREKSYVIILPEANRLTPRLIMGYPVPRRRTIVTNRFRTSAHATKYCVNHTSHKPIQHLPKGSKQPAKGPLDQHGSRNIGYPGRVGFDAVAYHVFGVPWLTVVLTNDRSVEALVQPYRRNYLPERDLCDKPDKESQARYT